MAGELDRLSALPDCLLHTIMSFLKARQVMQTCVLSRRWMHLWRSAPCFDIDLDEFKAGTTYRSYYVKDRDWQEFEDFAVNLMLRCNVALLDSFRLSVPKTKAPTFGAEVASSWFRRAMKYSAPDPRIQREGLSSNSWRLKRLHLCDIFLDNHFAEHVSSACHSLEDLELRGCRYDFADITSHSLKNLILKNCACLGPGLSDITSSTLKSLVIDGGFNTGRLLVITAPAIASLCLVMTYDYSNRAIEVNEMPSLEKASIHLGHFCHCQFKILSSISNATRLQLSNLGTMVLDKESTFKEFKNLRNLLLDNCDLSDDFQTLALFLENSPNLEKLTLRYCKFSNDSKKKKRKAKANKTCRSLDVKCVNLALSEIIYKEDDVHQLVELLLRISGKLPKNNLKLRKVD